MIYMSEKSLEGCFPGDILSISKTKANELVKYATGKRSRSHIEWANIVQIKIPLTKQLYDIYFYDRPGKILLQVGSDL